MGFPEVMGVCLNLPRKSLQLEIDGFMELIDPSIEKPMTKQAFSKARHNILPSAFKELFELNLADIHGQDMILPRKGWRIFAIDGTELQLPGYGEMLRSYKHNSEHSLPHARASILCDVVSGFIVHAAIDTTARSERSLALEHLEYFRQFKREKDLVIFDRGYPSGEMIKNLASGGFKFLFRVPRGFNIPADNSAEIDFSANVQGQEVRAVKVSLPGGETELLFTNLTKEDFGADEFAELYHLRWSVETKYNTLKNKLEIESFSGRTLATVQQDFWAALFLSNIAAAIKRDSDEAIGKRNEGRQLRYEYKTNENILIGKLKNNLVKILLEDDGDVRGRLLIKLIERISSFMVPVRPGRSFPRKPDQHKKIGNKPRRAL